MKSSGGAGRAYLYVMDEDDRAVPRLALAFIPAGEKAIKEMNAWIMPNRVGSNESKIAQVLADCEIIETVPGGEVCLEGTDECTYHPPIEELVCGLNEPQVEGPGWPDDDGGGGGGGGSGCPYNCTNDIVCSLSPTPINCQVDLDPCEQAEVLEGDSQFISKMNMLQNYANTENHEVAYGMFGYANGGYNYIYQEGENGMHHMSINSLVPIDGFIHSHFDGGELTFSMDDIRSIQALYDQGAISDLSTFTIGVVTYVGSSHLLKIKDENKFSSFMTNYLRSQSGFTTISTYYNSMAEGYELAYGETPEAAELAMAKTLQEHDAGIQLFKGDASFDDWQPFENQNASYTPVNCTE